MRTSFSCIAHRASVHFGVTAHAQSANSQLRLLIREGDQKIGMFALNALYWTKADCVVAQADLDLCCPHRVLRIRHVFYKNLLPFLNENIWYSLKTPTVLLTFGKTFFAWRFILNENILFWLTISYQKPFVFSVSVFCSQICTLKLYLWPKISLTYTVSIVKWFFWIFCLRIFFYFSLLNLNYWCFTTIL